MTTEQQTLELPMAIDGPRISLVAPGLDDAQDLFDVVDASREHLGRFLPWPQTIRTVADEGTFVEDRMTKRAEGLEFGFLIRTVVGGDLVGTIGVFAISNHHRCCEIGYWLSEAGEGHGYMTEAVALLEGALLAAGMHHVEIRCSADNTRSAAVPERLGYTLDGTLRERFNTDDGYRDCLVFSKLSTDD